MRLIPLFDGLVDGGLSACFETGSLEEAVVFVRESC